MDLPTWRSTFPEFGDVSAYPSAQVSFYLGIATIRLNAALWGELFDYGMGLYTAHCMALARRRGVSAARGLIPGVATGLVTAKSVADVSQSFDVEVGTIEGAGNYNLTDYGTEFYELMQIVGMGAIQLGGCAALPGPLIGGYLGLVGYL